MSQAQLDSVIQSIAETFGAWGEDASLEDMRRGWDGLFAAVKPTVGAKSEPVDAGGVKAEWITAPDADPGRVVLYFHGGAYVLGSIDSHRDLCERLSRAAQARVLALDYRLAPENPYPAAVEDATAAYRWLLKQGVSPKRICVAGDSAGGGLTVATLIALRDAGDPMPACATPISPWADLQCQGGSMQSKAEEDPIVQREMLEQMASAYVPDAARRGEALASPVNADLAGLPPLLIHVGSREILLDDAVRIHEKAKAAGVDSELDVWDGQIHVWHTFAGRLDEGEQAIGKLGEFIRRHTV